MSRSEAEAHIARLTADLAAAQERERVLRADAERYRFMRDTDDAMWRPFGLRHGGDEAKADAAVDAARAALATSTKAPA